MNRLRVIMLSACLTGTLLFSPTTINAAPPSYLILRAPRSPLHTGRRHTGFGYGVSTRTYAYGWFGIRSRRHSGVHYGYYGQYTQRTSR